VGKWCQVKCDCVNRRPLPGSDWFNYDDYIRYVKKPRLGKTEAEWKETVKHMYECGHRNGNYIEFWLGGALDAAFKSDQSKFETFRRISDWRRYDDEFLAISKEEVVIWRIEIGEVAAFVRDEAFLGWHEKQDFENEVEKRELLYGDIEDTLVSATRLCDASLATGNPIEFLW